MSYKFADFYIKLAKEENNVDESIWMTNGNYQMLVKILQVFSLIVISILFYAFKYIWPKGVFWDAKTQLYAIISGAFILLYNGKRGYNAKWFQYGSYLYYPLHLMVLVIIYIISNGGL